MAESKKVRRQGGPMGGPHGMAPVEKAKDLKGTIKKLWEYLSKYKVTLMIVLVFAILSTVFSIVGPKILGNATTLIFEGVMNKIADNGIGMDFDGIRNIIIKLVGLYVISALFSYLQTHIMVGVSTKITYGLRKSIQAKINKLPLAYFDKKSYGEVLSYVTNDIDTISQNLSQGLTQLITSFATVIGIAVMMFSISWQMTLVSLLVLPISGGLIGFIMKKSQKHFKDQQEYLGHINGHVEEMYSNHNIVKVFNGEEKSVEDFNKYNETLYVSSWKSQFFSGLMFPIMNFIGNLGYVAICILGGYLAIKGNITVGDIQSFIQYMRQFTQPIAQIAQVSNVIQSTAAASERVFAFLDEEEEVEDIKKPASAQNIKGAVKFENVHFGYNKDKVVINDFSAKVNAGQKIAIVGPTGAGKTTIVKLLMRYYDVNNGSIEIDGINIKDFKRDDLRSLFAMVLQDTWAFNDTIMENIRYGKLDSSDEEVIEAGKNAQVDHFVHTLSEGYNTILNEESSNISARTKTIINNCKSFLGKQQITNTG